MSCVYWNLNSAYSFKKSLVYIQVFAHSTTNNHICILIIKHVMIQCLLDIGDQGSLIIGWFYINWFVSAVNRNLMTFWSFCQFAVSETDSSDDLHQVNKQTNKQTPVEWFWIMLKFWFTFLFVVNFIQVPYFTVICFILLDFIAWQAANWIRWI